MTPHLSPIEILLIEDNPGDVRLTKELLADAKVLNNVTAAADGEEALAVLRGRDGAPSFRPDLILLDLNLPGKSGLEVLEEIKTDAALKTIPVIILSSSQAEMDIARSYFNHANGYVVKPVDLTRFTEVIQAIETFWLAVVRLPPR